MSRGEYSRLPMYATSSSSSSTPRLRSSSSTSTFKSKSPSLTTATTSPITDIFHRQLTPSPSSPSSPPPPFSSRRHRDHDHDRDHDRRRFRWNRATAQSQSITNTLQSLLRPRVILSIVKVVVPLLVTVVFVSLLIWEPHIELAFYEKAWIQKEILPVGPLGGCFDEGRVSERYNVSRNIYGPKTNEVQAGVSLKLGMDCYDFAGTVRSSPSSLSRFETGQEGRTHFHSYWRTDLAPFGERQAHMLKSFFATQPLERSKLVLWSNGPLSPPEKPNRILEEFLSRYPESFELRVADVRELAVGTELEGSELLRSSDEKAWTDGDLIRLLVVWKDGGVWVDMDSLLTRDLTPLLEHEFVTQWDCYGMSYSISYTLTYNFAYPVIHDGNVVHCRQDLLPLQRRAPPLPRPITLPLRSLSPNRNLPRTETFLNRLGLPPLPQALASSRPLVHPTLQNPTLLLQRRTFLSSR